MAIAIDRTLIEDINDPSFEVINYCIEEHAKEIPRLQMLFDYYDGKPHKIKESARETPHELNQVYVNNAKYVTDMMTGFALGNPVSYSAPTEQDITPVTDALQKMKIAKHDMELEKGLSSMGVGLELHYLSIKQGTNETVPKVAWIDPRGMFLVVDDTVDRTPLFAVRLREKDFLGSNSFWEITVYTQMDIITYKSKAKKLVPGQLVEEPTVTEHFYGDVPVVEFRNNEEKQGDYEQQLSQIDAYNLLQTNRIQDKKNFVKAVMFLYGFSLPKEKPKSVNGGLVINAPAAKEGTKAEYVTNTFDESQVQVLADSLLDDFHKTSYVPNMNDENFGGNISGEAMKFKLLGLLLVLAVKTGYFEDGIVRRLKLIENILNVKGQNVDTDDITVKFKVNLPFNRKDVIDQIQASQDFVPLLISLGWLDDIDDPQAVIEMLNQQKDENVKRANEALGTQSPDLDLGEEEEDGKEGNGRVDEGERK